MKKTPIMLVLSLTVLVGCASLLTPDPETGLSPAEEAVGSGSAIAKMIAPQYSGIIDGLSAAALALVGVVASRKGLAKLKASAPGKFTGEPPPNA